MWALLPAWGSTAMRAMAPGYPLLTRESQYRPALKSQLGSVVKVMKMSLPKKEKHVILNFKIHSLYSSASLLSRTVL